MSKGSKSRPIPNKEKFEDNWDKIFGKTKVAEGIENDTFFERPAQCDRCEKLMQFLEDFETCDDPVARSKELLKEIKE
ncbi:MAG: hypothetical protein NZ811_03190 [Gammaproteobacteria bacterium]|nr:hypothetical protein [Gammaproteobacteria bacterium]